MPFKTRSKSTSSPAPAAAVPRSAASAASPETPAVSLDGLLTGNLPDMPRPSSSVTSSPDASRSSSSSSSSGVLSTPPTPAAGVATSSGLPPIPRDPAKMTNKEKRLSFSLLGKHQRRGSLPDGSGSQAAKQRSNSTPQSAQPLQRPPIDWVHFMPSEQILRAQYDRYGNPTAATEELWDQRTTVQCLGYGTPRPTIADEHFGRPPSYRPF